MNAERSVEWEDKISLERIVPDKVREEPSVTGSETLQLHLARYEFAARHARPGRLLDIACGVGYGSDLIRRQRSDIDTVIGVDLSADAIAYAKRRYGQAGIDFRQHDAMTFEDSRPFDTVISLETIEHLPDPWAFVKNLAGILSSQAVLICSVPVTPSVDANPHHLHDFTPRSFKKMFDGLGLRQVVELNQVQSYSITKVALRGESRMKATRSNLAGYYLRNPLSAVKRISSLLRDGFNNKYLTVVWQRTS